MKEKFEKPEVEVIMFGEAEDIITCSGQPAYDPCDPWDDGHGHGHGHGDGHGHGNGHGGGHHGRP